MATRSAQPNPKDFPEPHNVATWIAHRDPQFKTHRSLGQAKNAISGRLIYRRGTTRIAGCDMYVYEWDEETVQWVQLHHIPKDTDASAHPFMQKVQRRKGPIKGPSDKAVEAAIASIVSAATCECDIDYLDPNCVNPTHINPPEGF